MTHERSIEGASPLLIRADEVSFSKNDHDLVAQVRKAIEEILHRSTLSDPPAVFAVVPKVIGQEMIDRGDVPAVYDLVIEVPYDVFWVAGHRSSVTAQSCGGLAVRGCDYSPSASEQLC